MEVSAGFREVFFDYIDALKLIIRKKSERKDVAEQGMFNGYTRLIDAMLIGRTDAIKLLLAHPANRDIRGFNGWKLATPFRGNMETSVLNPLCDTFANRSQSWRPVS